MGARLTLLLIAVATVHPWPNPAAIEIPFRLHRDHLLLVTGRIGSLSDLVFVLDTGSGRTIVDAEVTAKLGLGGKPTTLGSFGATLPAAVVALPGLELGSYQVGSLDVLSLPLGSTAALLDLARLDALIGIDVLRKRSFRIDYGARALVLGTASDLRFRTPLIPNPVFPVVRAEVTGRLVNLIVDTGASHLTLFDDAGRQATEAAADPNGDRAPVQPSRVGGALQVRPLQLDRIWIGAWNHRAVAALVAPRADDEMRDIDGLLSLTTLGASVVQLDFERGELAWKP